MREGTVLKGKYRLVRELGKGGMGEVWEARDERLERPVAVKFLLGEPAEADLLRFAKEGRTLAGFQHENILRVHDVNDPDESPYLVTEWLDGDDLAKVLRAQGRFEPNQVVEIAVQVCDGLAYAHERGIVHRDLKPGNVILLGSAGRPGAPPRVKLIDFGLAKQLAPSGDSARLTREGGVLGTPDYMAPEQCLGEPATGRSDLYALGCLMYALLTGDPPFTGEPLQVMYQQCHEEPDPIGHYRPEGVPQGLARLVHRLLAKEPADRPGSAAEVREELLGAAGEPGGGRPSIPSPRGGPAAGGDQALIPTGRFEAPGRPALESARDSVPETSPTLPLSTRRTVPRPELADQGVELLTELAGDEDGEGLLGLVGPGGFGKSTLAAQMARDPRVRALFPDGVLWVELGQHVTGAALASRINDVCERVSGTRPGFTHPEQAGAHLRHVLGEQRRLLVVDDVWDRTQLRPFLDAEARTVRLVTTRVRSALPDGASVLPVGAMRRAEARAMLAGALTGVGTDEIDAFVRLLGHWPVLVALAAGAVRFAVEGGAAPADALARVRSRLAGAGPTALDLADERDRSRAISATVGAGLSLLGSDEAECYRALAIFPEDTEIPEEAVRWAWTVNGSAPPAAVVERMCTRFADLSLLTPVYADGGLRVRLHDTLRAYLRGSMAPEALAEVNARFLDAAAADLTPTGPAGPDTAWWAMPAGQTYLWAWLCRHLAEAGRAEHIAPLVGDLRYLTAKLRLMGPAELVSDLAMGGDEVAGLRRAVGMSAPLLTPGDLPASLDDVLLSRIAHVLPGDARGLAEVYHAGRPALVNAEPLPDLPPPNVRHILDAHDGSVWGSAVTPDGTRAVTGGGDRLVRVWDVAAGRQICALPGHESTVNACVVGSSGTWAATCSDDRTVRVWDLAEAEETLVLDDFAQALQSLAAPAGGAWLAAGDAGGTLSVRGRADGSVLCDVKAHAGGVRACAADPAGTWILTGGEDRHVRIWSGADHRPLADLTDHEGGVWAAASSPDGTLAVTGDSTGTVLLRAMPHGEVLRVVAQGRGGVRACAFAPDASWVAVGREDGTVRLHRLDEDDLTGREFLANAAVQTCAAGPDGSWLLGGDASGQIRVWDTDVAPTWSGLRVLPAIQAMGVHPDGSLITGDAAGEVRVWDLAGERVRARFEGHTSGVWSVDFSPGPGGSGTYGGSGTSGSSGAVTVATSGDDRTICLWDASDGRLCRRHHLPCGINTAHFTATGTRLITGGTDGGIRLVDAGTGEVLYQVQNRTANVWDCHPDSGGSWFLAGGDDGVTTARAVATGETLAEIDHGTAVWGLAMAGDDVAVAGTADGSLHVWRPDTGELRVVPGAHPGGVWLVRPSPDGTWMVSVGEDRTVRTWSLPDVHPLLTLSGHTSCTSSCAVHPDGTWFASGDSGGTTRIWDAATGRPLALLTDHATGVRACAAVPGAVAVTGGPPVVVLGGDDGGVRVQGPRGERELTGHQGIVRAVAPDRTGTVVLTAGDDGAVRLHDLRRGGHLDLVPAGGPPVWGAAFGPDEFGMLVADVAGKVARLAWDGRTVAEFDNGGVPVRACAVSPDGSLMAWAGDRGVVQVRESATGRVYDVQAFAASVRALAFAPDGTWIAAAGLDGGVHVWAATGRGPRRSGWHDTAVRACAVHPRHGWLATADAGGTLRVWDPATMRCLARMRVGAPLHDCAWAGDDIILAGVAGRYRFTLTGAAAAPPGPPPSADAPRAGRTR